MLKENSNECCLPDERPFEWDIAVFSGEKVVEVEVESAELSECLGTENVRKANEEVRQDAPGNCRSKGDVCGIGTHEEYGHHHVHCNNTVNHDIGDCELSLLFVNSEEVRKLIIAMRNHVDDEVRSGS